MKHTNLCKILSHIDILEAFGNTPDVTYEITSVCMDSRTVIPNALFVCVKGYLADGHHYALMAYEKGAKVFVVEKQLELPPDAYQILVEDSRIALARLSAAYYDHPASKLHLIGITGTKGKTTTSLFIRNILERAHIPTGYIGTNGVIYGNIHTETANSTPESLVLQRHLHDMVEAGIKVAVLEVSSQGLWMHRVEGICFDTCIFTNLSSDHIGTQEHPDMAHYRACKKLLFTNHSHENSMIIGNIDDPETPYMTAGVKGRIVSISTYEHTDAAYVGYNISSQQDAHGLSTSFSCRINGKTFSKPWVLPMAGEFNVKNALCATAVACEVFGLTPETVLHTLSHTQVEGRFETLSFPSLPGVKFVIDYAHNGLSMAAALDALRACNPSRLICVFGSVGCRSHSRRAELAQAAGPRADLCILTSDNPNTENPLDILKQIDAAFPAGSCKRELIVDRTKALERVVKIAQPGDIILLAGKGHEHTQVIAGRVEPYNERQALESIIFSQSDALLPY